MVPTKDEILEQTKKHIQDDPLGFEVLEYLVYLDYEHLIKLKPDAKVDPKEVHASELTRDRVVTRMTDYIEFAYEKARGERGISANRSIQHYIAWTWLAGDREFSERIREVYRNGYCGYGIPILNMICEHYGFDIPEA